MELTATDPSLLFENCLGGDDSERSCPRFLLGYVGAEAAF